MDHTHETPASRAPLFILIGLILLCVLALGAQAYSLGTLTFIPVLEQLCAGFFLVFGGAKLLDLRGFVDGFSTYDLLAGRVRLYGYLYPFLEFALGLAYLVGQTPLWVHIVTLVIMVFGALGVLIALAKKRKITCACLGSIIKVPLTTITLWENLVMALMAGVMIVLMSMPQPVVAIPHTMTGMSVTSERQFIEQMIPHHQEAVDSSQALLQRQVSPQMKTLLTNVVTAQTKEIATMRGWLRDWYGSASLNEGHYMKMMPSLDGLTDKEAVTAYIKGMIGHHEGAITMARQVLNHAQHPEVTQMAQDIIRTQTQEIEMLRSMLP